MIKYNDKIYAFDLEKIFNCIAYSDKTESKQREINDAYEFDNSGNKTLTSKVIREITSPGDVQVDNIKYDLIKMLINRIIYNEDEIEDLTNISFIIPFNTLLKEGLLIEIE